MAILASQAPWNISRSIGCPPPSSSPCCGFPLTAACPQDGSFYDGPVRGLTLNFNTEDLTTDNGAIRQIPGSHRVGPDEDDPPHPDLEPRWMRWSTVAPLKAGGCIFRDLRCWHGGSPNLSAATRSLPNVEYWYPADTDADISVFVRPLGFAATACVSRDLISRSTKSTVGRETCWAISTARRRRRGRARGCLRAR